MFSYNAVFIAQQHRLCPLGKLDLKQNKTFFPFQRQEWVQTSKCEFRNKLMNYSEHLEIHKNEQTVINVIKNVINAFALK